MNRNYALVTFTLFILKCKPLARALLNVGKAVQDVYPMKRSLHYDRKN